MLMLSFVLRHTLVVIFVVSGAAKLADRRGTLQAVGNFGIPERLTRPVAALLPVAELGVAAVLLIEPVARLGGALALVLLAAFTALVAWNLAHGRRPECNCFGRIGGSDISGRTLIRNSLLAVAALVVVLSQAETPSAWPAALVGSIVLAGALLGVEHLAGRAAVARKQAAIDAEFDAAMAAPGAFEKTPAPEFALEDAGGATRTLASLLDGHRPVLLSFVSPGCGPCMAFKPSLTRWAQVYSDRLQLAVATVGSRDANQAMVDQLADVPVLFDDGSVRTDYGVTGTPGAALVAPDGLLAGPPAIGEANIRKLLAAALTGTEVDLGARPPTGEPAESIGLSSAPAPLPTVTAQTGEDGTVFLIDEGSGATASINQIGAIIWECLDGDARLDELVADLAETFGAPHEVVEADVLDFVRSVGRAGLLVGIAPELPEPDAVPHGNGNAHHHGHDHHGHAHHHGHDHHGHDHHGHAHHDHARTS